ncbi:NUDIX domain-containing protein [Rothia sp. P7181]|uniref:NUDIX domain-containing protein n=1 Tax=Rothia sp. P7181 TaxID=3402663 RepID=UPI003ADBCFD3
MHLSSEELTDDIDPRPLHRRELLCGGRIWDVVRESVSLTEESKPFERDFLDHPGAVAIAVLNEEYQILLIRQYRHPVRANLWEIPAGLLDVAGETPLEAAQRELAEEAFLRAKQWDTLMEFYNSPGGSTETCRVFLARDITPIDQEHQHIREDEESEIVMRWVNLDDAVTAVLSGRIHNPSATNAILATYVAHQQNFAHLYSAHAPFEAHPRYRTKDYIGPISPAEKS